MDVVNVDTADTITLDDNANFLTGGGANIALAPNDSIRVCSNGTYWYHVEDKIAGGAASTALSSITDATATNTIDNDNYAQVWNWNTLTTQDAMTIASTAQTTGSLLRLHSANASGLGSALYIESDQTGGSGNVSALDVSSNAAGSGTNAINAFVNSSGAVAISASNGNGTSISARTTTDTQPTIFSWNNSVTGPAVGLEGASETTGTGAGVYGNINGTNNTGYGVWGQNASRSGYGVFSEGALRVAPAAMTLANGAAIDYNTAIFTAPTLTVGSTNVTSMMDSYLFQAPTLTRGSAVTVTNASTMTIAGAPVRAGSLALTNTHGLYIGAGAVSTATNSYGLYANAQTGATNNYAAALMGGYVGIGINAPTNTLHVEGDMSYTPLVKIRNTNALGVSGLELFDDANAFKGVFGHFNFDYDGVTDPLGIVANDNDIVFVTGDTGSAPGTVRMMVDASSGFVGIGNITPTVALDVAGDIRHTGIIIDASDIRLKTDIRHLPEVKGDILARLQQIKGYQFRMKDDTSGQIEYGVIAQEIERVFPELVVTDKTAEGMKSVNYVGLIAPLIEATKELKSENDSLKAKIADFDARMAALENNVDELKLFTGFGVSKASMGLLGIFALLIMSGIVVVIRRKTLAQ